ncbi:MAG: hypothetical protein M3552_13235 [Planctomycetota bacterium]|nr:hypothetical protein [Planctomycetota bacterium]
MKVAGHVSLAELERLERSERDAAKGKRLRIVILAIKGDTAPAIAMSLGLSRRICHSPFLNCGGDRAPPRIPVSIALGPPTSRRGSL